MGRFDEVFTKPEPRSRVVTFKEVRKIAGPAGLEYRVFQVHGSKIWQLQMVDSADVQVGENTVRAYRKPVYLDVDRFDGAAFRDVDGVRYLIDVPYLPNVFDLHQTVEIAEIISPQRRWAVGSEEHRRLERFETTLITLRANRKSAELRRHTLKHPRKSKRYREAVERAEDREALLVEFGLTTPHQVNLAVALQAEAHLHPRQILEAVAAVDS